MNENNIDDNVKSFYNQKKLSSKTLKRLKQAIYDHSEPSNKSIIPIKNWFEKIFSFSRSPALVSAISCLLLIVAVSWQFWSEKTIKVEHIRSAVVKEVIMNHKKALSPEFAQVSFNDLGRLMTKLEFSPIMPEMLEKYRLTFLGSRYCSIQGNLAVQLKFKTISGKIGTLYQTPVTTSLAHIKTTQIQSNDPQLLLWHERGLFMAMTGELN